MMFAISKGNNFDRKPKSSSWNLPVSQARRGWLLIATLEGKGVKRNVGVKCIRLEPEGVLELATTESAGCRSDDTDYRRTPVLRVDYQRLEGRSAWHGLQRTWRNES